MAFTSLASKSWGTQPTIPFKPSYEMRRKGADMEYRYHVEIAPITGESYFGFPIYLESSLDDVKVENVTLKGNLPNRWSDPITYTSEWFTVKNKTVGTTKLKLRLYSGNGSSRNTTYTYSLPISPAESIFGTIEGNMIGEPIVINITSYDDSFTHQLWYSFGKKTWQHLAMDVDTSATFTPPLSLCSEIPNTTKGQLTLILRTYSGTTQVGVDVYETIDINVPSSIVPTIDSITIQEAIASIKEKTDLFLQNLSKLQITINNAQGVYGSTITQQYVTFENTTYIGNSITTGLIKSSGELIVRATARDSRNRTCMCEEKIHVTPYDIPKILKKPDGGRRSDDGSIVDIILNIKGYSVLEDDIEKNILHVYVLPKLVSNTYYPDIGEDYRVLSTQTFDLVDKEVSILNMDKATTYNLLVVVTDNFGGYDEYPIDLPTEEVMLDRNRRGLGVQKRWEKGALDVHGDIYTDKSIHLVDLIEFDSAELIKKFPNGLWIGNNAPSNVEGDFTPKQGYYGIFISSTDLATYSVKDGDMQDMHTGGGRAVFS